MDAPRDPDPPAGFLRRVLWSVAIVLLAVGLVALLGWSFRGLLLAFAGVLLAVFLYRVATQVARWTHLSYRLALAVVLVLLLAALGGTVWLVEARVASQVDRLQDELPQAWAQAQDSLSQSRGGQWLLTHGRSAGAALQEEVLQSSANIASSLGTVLGEIFVVVFIGIFGAISPQLYVRGLLRLVPLPHRPRAKQVTQAAGEILWWWLIGQLAAMAFLGALTGLGVWLLGLRLALTLGLIAALANFVPNFGPVVAALPALLLAVLQGPMTVVWVLVLYVGLQFLQNHLVTPLVQQQTVQLSPVALILAQVFLYSWGGLLGMALAPPLAAVALRVVKMLYLEDRLQDPLQQRSGFWPDGAGATDSGNAPG